LEATTTGGTKTLGISGQLVVAVDELSGREAGEGRLLDLLVDAEKRTRKTEQIHSVGT